MNFVLTKITVADEKQFKQDMQEAFQKGFEDVYGEIDDVILPEQDIEQSIQGKGGIVYKALVDDKMVGGAIVSIDDETQCNELQFLYVKYGTQSSGIGKHIWDAIEQLHPETKAWETCTPYFEKRNIHFYVNKCGFHITEFHREEELIRNGGEPFIGDGGEGMFMMKKYMK